MKHSICEQCHQSYSVNQMFLVLGRSLCEKCADANLAQLGQQKLSKGSVTRQTDPTVCFGCGRDNGNAPLPTLGGNLPVCMDCEQKFRNQPFPGWIKAALTALLALAVVSFVHNWRFFKAYLEIQKGVRSAEVHKLEAAVALLDSASRRVPESGDVASLAAYYRGAYLLSLDKSAEALPHLQKASQTMPQNESIQELILEAEMGAAFDHKDYDQFLAKSKTVMNRNPRQPTAIASVASAFACKWAVTGEEGFRQEALKNLDLAGQMAGPKDPGFKEYKGRILYRLDSRQIITRQEYTQRFPNGYVRKGETP